MSEQGNVIVTADLSDSLRRHSTWPTRRAIASSQALEKVVRIKRKFWIDSRGHRWVAYCAGDVMVALTLEELDVQEIAA